MTQSKLSSFYEACINIIIGFALNFALNLWLIPAFVTDATGRPAHISLVDNWWMGCAYTVFSLIRSYTIRRWFNARLRSLAERLAGGSV